MKELTIDEIQDGGLLVLKKLKNVCEKAKVNYFLMFGTLIGAVRHKGIIPWDDDIDVGMMRSDFDKFLLYCQTHEKELLPFKLYYYTTKKDYIYPIARFVDTRYVIDYQNFRDYDLGLFVDVYPFDGCGDNEDECTKIFRKVRKNLMPLISLGARKNVMYNHGFLNFISKTAIRWVALCIGQNHLLKWIDHRVRKYAKEDSAYVNCIVWDNTRAKMFPRCFFENLVEAPFEDDFFKIPQNYDSILRLEYGDYTQLPPEEERIGHHYYKAYRKEQ